MGRRFLKFTVLSCIIFLLFGTLSYAQNLERIFNSGVNFGWLRYTTALGIDRDSWSEYASNGTQEYNNAFSPPRDFKTPPASVAGAQDAIAYIAIQVDYIRGAKGLFLGAANLAYTHVYAVYGRCPSCLRKTMLAAGRHLKGAGRTLGNQDLSDEGTRWETTAASLNPKEMDEEDVRAFATPLVQSIIRIQISLQEGGR